MIDKRFVYTGAAVGLSARITRIMGNANLNHVVPVQGASVLPQTGGISESKTGDFTHKIKHPDKRVVVKVGSTKTRAVGLPDGDLFRTEVSTELTQVDFFDMLHIDSASAKMVSIHDGHNDFPLVAPESVLIKGMRLGKTNVQVTFDLEPFQQCKTKRALAAKYATDANFRKACAARFNADPSSTVIPEYHGFFVASVVREIKLVGENNPDISINGYTIVWNGFGTIILGEMLISDYLRRFSLVRLKMGSDVSGDGTVGGVDGDSHTMP